MFRWGVLSTAPIAREQFIPGVAQSENGVVAAIASLTPGRAQEVAERFAIPNAFESYEALLASPDVDGVYIPTPTAHHVADALKAIEAGKHVLCEKPIAMKAEDVDRIIAARDASGLVVSEAFMVTYHPQWRRVRQLIAEGAIGRLRHVQGAFSYHNLNPESSRNRTDLGGGALPDIGVYPVVTTRFATGLEPMRVAARVERDPTFGTDVYSWTTAEFPGFHLTFYCSTQMALRQRMTFHGDAGFIEVAAPFNAGLYGADLVHVHNADHRREETLSFTGVHQYRLEAEEFVRAVRGEPAEIFTLESSKANQRVIDAIFRAGETGGWAEM